MTTVDPVEITVVVVTHAARHFLADCLDSLISQTVPHRLLIVDNASTDGTAALLAERFPQVEVLRPAVNGGFAGGVAAGLAVVGTPWMALLNDDAVAEADWLAALLTVARHVPGTAAVTSRMLLADGSGVNNLGVALTADGHGFDIALGAPLTTGFGGPTPVFGFSGGAALIDVAALRAVGGCPEAFFLYYEDTDMSWRLRLAGHQILSVPAAVVHHRHSASVGNGSRVFHFHNERNRLLMLLRCAPMPVAVGQLARFLLTTASITVRRWRRTGDTPLNLRPALRWQVLAAVARMLPATLSARRRISRTATRDRAAVAREWLGRTPVPGQPTAVR